MALDPAFEVSPPIYPVIGGVLSRILTLGGKLRNWVAKKVPQFSVGIQLPLVCLGRKLEYLGGKPPPTPPPPQ